MKNKLYLFSDTVVKRQAHTLTLEKICLDADTEQISEEPDEIEQIPQLNIEKEDYLTDDNCWFTTGEKKIIPVEGIDSVYSFGSVKFNSRLIYFLSRNQIPLHVFNYYGGYSGSFYPSERNISGSLLVKQITLHQNKYKRLLIAKQFVISAILNALSNLRYYKNRGTMLSDTIEQMEELKEAAEGADSVSELMGYEGLAKKAYYSSWKNIFQYPVDFSQRVKNPPNNLINALISYGNSIVYCACLDEIYRTRLYPEIGFLHEPGDNKLCLSYDIAEIFKPIITDRAIFKVINKNMISEDEAFKKNGRCTLKKAAKETFVAEIENKLSTLIQVTGKEKRYSYRRLIREECYKLIEYITHDEEYKAYVSKW